MNDRRNRRVANGAFITFEGVEGAGKTTQVDRLREALAGQGYDVLKTREPGGTPLGEELRRLLMHLGTADSPCPAAEVLLMGAARAQHMQRVILPHLAGGGVVLCDRFADSTTVYQGHARAISLAFIAAMHELTVGGRWPDLTLILDLEPEEGLRRTRLRSPQTSGGDRFEAESLAFHRRVREGFAQLAAAHRERIVLIDAQPSPECVHRRVLEAASRVLARLQ
ncbi:MAG: Thymidylate kinase [Lentisphaerae bacterium ADurb.BinA184]|nr:MAG: Thymidylate kinase [Lentisphaerae bacterium ADurb.BinA184]